MTETQTFSLKSVWHNIKQLFTLDYYKKGFSGWTKESYILLAFGVTFLTITGLVHGVNEQVILSWVASLLSFSCVLAISNGRIINGLLGGISAILITIVALQSGNPSDAIMQGVYFIVLDAPIILFGNVWANTKIKGHMDKKGWAIAILTFLVSFTLLYFMDASLLHTPRPILDAFAASIGITGAALMLGKYSAQYYLWTAQGILSVILWGVTAYQGDGNWVLFANYMLFILNDIIGLFASPWAQARKDEKAEKQQAKTNK